MSNHAAVTADGGEVGRAQAAQAIACGIDVERRMNPILLKPTGGHRSHLVVMGDEVAVDSAPTSTELKAVVLEAWRSLRADNAWVVAEGAGGAAEINLLDRDLVNLPLARAAGVNTVLVVDIDRGGAYASAFGSIELVPPELKATIGGVLFNRFRGDPGVLDSGNRQFEQRTGVPILGVLPALDPAPMLGVEDSLDIVTGAVPADHSIREFVSAPIGGTRSIKPVRVAAVRLPHLANPSDLDPFTIEPDVALRWAVSPSDLDGADMIVVPGSRATVSDLDWLRRSGIAQYLAGFRSGSTPRDAANPGTVIVGICGGYQMFGDQIDDKIESGRGLVEGLGLLPVTTVFSHPKIVERCRGSVTGMFAGPTTASEILDGYQIRWGRPSGGIPWLDLDGDLDGAVAETSTALILGTSLHGVFDNDLFRTRLLSLVAERTGRVYQQSPVGLLDAVDGQNNRLADWLDADCDIERLLALAGQAVSPGQEPGW